MRLTRSDPGWKVARFGGSEVALVFIIIVVSLIVWVIGAWLSDEFTSLIVDDPLSSNASITSINKLNDNYISVGDDTIAMLYIFLSLGLILSVFFIDAKPVFWVMMLLLGLLSIVAILEVANTGDEVLTDDTFGTYANQFTAGSWILNHLVESAFATLFMTLIALYAKSRYFT